MADDGLSGRLEMLLVVKWLDAGRPPDGEVGLDVGGDLTELGLDQDRRASLRLLSALGELEDAGRVTVRWPATAGGPATVTLAADLRTDSSRLFGRD